MGERPVTISVQNDRGEWVPAIPEPYFLRDWLGRLRLQGRCRCDCGRVFRTRQRYREHAALVHVLGLS